VNREKLKDTDKMPSLSQHERKGKYCGTVMSEVPDSYLVWLYGMDWLKSSCPEIHDYIVRNANVLPDLILRQEDK